MKNCQKTFLFFISLILTLGTITYPFLNSLPFGDDFIFIFGNNSLSNVRSPLAFWNPFSNFFKSWPLAYSFIWLEKLIFAENFFAYRIVNLFVHFINIFLFYKILQNKKNKKLFTAIATFQSIALTSLYSIFQIKTLLATTFVLLSLLFINRKNCKIALAAFFLSLFTKTIAIITPLAIIKSKKDLLILFLIIPFLVIGLYGLTANNANLILKTPHDYLDGDILGSIIYKLFSSFHTFYFFIIKFLGLINIKLVYEYHNISLINISLIAFSCASFSFILIKNYSDFYMKAFICSFIPISGIIMIPFHQFSFFADHWLYLLTFLLLIFIFNSYSQFKTTRYLAYIVLLANLFQISSFTFNFENTISYIEKENKDIKSGLRFEYLIQLYIYTNQPHLAIDKAIEGYDWIYRKKELIDLIAEVSNKYNIEKGIYFIKMRNVIEAIEQNDMPKIKSNLHQIPKDFCDSFCEVFKELYL